MSSRRRLNNRDFLSAVGRSESRRGELGTSVDGRRFNLQRWWARLLSGRDDAQNCLNSAIGNMISSVYRYPRS